MKRELLKKKILLTLLSSFLLTGCKQEQEEISLHSNEVEEVKEITVINEPTEEPKTETIPEIEEKEITISAIGDCTIGSDPNSGYYHSFTSVADVNDYSYFFSGVSDYLSNDDLTIANLETTFTTSNNRVDKKFNFKGDYEYVNILTEGSIEAVNLANNHTYDYGESGYTDTINTLINANISYFGYDNYVIKEIDGIKIGLAGLKGWDESSAKSNTLKAINYFKENNTDLIIMTYHWGVEREYEQNTTQENIAHYAIDNGADLVLGHHPHVLQGIEEYNSKYIVYSLGNFVFGGNRNPSDKDTMIFQITYNYIDNNLTNSNINIIPCSLSSVSDLNDYKPVPLEGDEYKRVLNKIKKYSINLEYEGE